MLQPVSAAEQKQKETGLLYLEQNTLKVLKRNSEITEVGFKLLVWFELNRT